MAKIDKPRYSNNGRKPPEIELKSAKRQTPPAEPIGLTKDTSEPKRKEAKSVPPKVENTQAPQKTSAKTLNFSSLIYGIIGGVITVVVLGGLQYSGAIPAPSSQATLSQIKALQEKINTLTQNENQPIQTEAMNVDQQAMRALETANLEFKNRITNLEQSVATLKDKEQQAHQATQSEQLTNNNQVSELPQNINPLSGAASMAQDRALTPTEHQSAKGLDSAAEQRINKELGELKLNISEFAGMKNDAAKALELAQKNQHDLSALEQEFAKTAAVKQLGSENLARLIAANSLKAAIDRGGSYTAELNLYKSAAPNDHSWKILENYAGTGLANNAELSEDFTALADKIAQFDNSPDQSAGFLSKLWAGVKKLVVTRPIGNIEGNAPSAIAARMEVAIKAGDYQRTISEWQNLPIAAKNISQDFMAKIQARHDADQLLTEIIAANLQSNQQAEK